MSADSYEKFQKGLALLNKPVLPLVRIVQLLYLTGPFERIEEVVAELREPIETNTAVYEDPQTILEPYLPALKELETLKHPSETDYIILTETKEAADPMESLDFRVTQLVITQELERINSLLCGPCNCTLCCTGPDEAMEQHFFEIPLQEREIELFNVTKVATTESRDCTSSSEPPLVRDGLPFYETEPAVYHWQSGWSLILGRLTFCPNLDRQTGGCRIYPNRPEVCRRPQIFPYAVERIPSEDKTDGKRQLSAYIKRNKILAVWDCPYVQQFKEQIAKYAELCCLEPVFKKNKA